MKILLFLLLLFCQDTDKLIQDLNNDDPVVREKATAQLIECEGDLEKFKTMAAQALNPEVKWRLEKAIKSIEANQKFRAATIISPLITLKFEGTIGDLFAKLGVITGQIFDARAFADNKVKIDCINTPLFKVLDLACKQIGFDWEINYRDSKGDVMDQYTRAPLLDYTTTTEICGVGMSDRTPHYTGQGFKMQAVQTSLSINNQFGAVTTEAFIQFRFAQDPGLKFAVGPKIKYTKITTDDGTELPDRSVQCRYAMFHAPPTTKSISIKGKATYRIPMKIETITLKGIDILKPNPNGNEVQMSFADYEDIIVVMNSSNNIEVRFSGVDNVFKDRFTGKYSVIKKGGTTILENGNGSASGGYINVSDDHLQFYIYGTPGSDDAISTITLEYITEFRDISFDFAIDNIPLY
jgi:hypothetical protein